MSVRRDDLRHSRMGTVSGPGRHIPDGADEIKTRTARGGQRSPLTGQPGGSFAGECWLPSPNVSWLWCLGNCGCQESIRGE